MALDRCCPGCNRPWKLCACDASTARWLRENAPDEEIPDEEDTGRLKGGHLCDRARGGKELQLAKLVSDMGGAVQRVDRTIELEPSSGHPLRHYREWLVARVQAIDAAQKANAAERKRHVFDIELIDERFDGAGLLVKEIAAKRGHAHSWASGHFARIESEARGRGVSVLAKRCRCGCGTHVAPNLRGRPRDYVNPKHEFRAKQRRMRARRRTARVIPESDTGKSREASAA